MDSKDMDKSIVYVRFFGPPCMSIRCRVIAIFQFSKMAALRHLGFVWGIFGPPTKGTCRSLSLCKIWSQSLQ